MKDRLKHIEGTLLCIVEAHIEELEKIDTKELGEVIDMIKDLEQATYYHCLSENEVTASYHTKKEID